MHSLNARSVEVPAMEREDNIKGVSQDTRDDGKHDRDPQETGSGGWGT